MNLDPSRVIQPIQQRSLEPGKGTNRSRLETGRSWKTQIQLGVSGVIGVGCFCLGGVRCQIESIKFNQPVKRFGDYHYEVKYVGTNRLDYGELKVF